MKRVVVYWILAVVNIFCHFFKIQQDRVTFISYESEKLERDFRLISRELEKDTSCNLKYVLMEYENTLIGNIKYLFNCIKQVYYVNTSKVILLDYNNFVVSNFKKKGVKIVQIWHASGAVKKFGNDVKREYPIKNYDYVICNSESWKKPFSTAFNVPEENVIPTGVPLTDRFFSSKKMLKTRRGFLKNYPQLNGKKVVLYAPTFRGEALKYGENIKIDLSYIKKQLGKDYILIYKLHPWVTEELNCNEEGIINGNNMSIRKLFSITDYLISDYSAIIYDFSILEKPMIFYTPDLKHYESTRGFYEDYEKVMPGPICISEDEIVKALKEDKFSIEEIRGFKNKYFKYQDGRSTQRVAEFIKTLVKEKL